MTNKLTAIDIRKALLFEGLRPSDYDEGALMTYINDHAIPILGRDLDSKDISTIAKAFYPTREDLEEALLIHRGIQAGTHTVADWEANEKK